MLIGLTEATGETAFISRPIGVAAVWLAQVPSPHALRVALEPGQAGPLHVGAVGEVLLAFAPVEVQEAALAEVPGGSGVQEALARVASEAIATDTGETFLGVTTVAVPIARGRHRRRDLRRRADRARRTSMAGADPRSVAPCGVKIQASLGSPPGD